MLFCSAIVYGVGQCRHAVQTVGKDAAPSILVAQRIKASLADMDANIANELLLPVGEKADSIQGYDTRRAEVTEGLVRAAQNITYGAAERKPIVTMVFGLGSYEELVSRVRVLHARQDPSVIAVYRQAEQVLQGTLFPAANALTKANTDVLDRTYARAQISFTLAIVLVTATGVALLTALIATQIFLSLRMRRLLNPALLVASLMTFGVMAHSLAALREDARQIKVAREDAFTSLQALWEARAVAYDGNTDESRWLLDRANVAALEEAFYRKAMQLVGIPRGEMVATITSAASQGKLPARTQGFLAQELANITFPGEKEAATQTLQTFGFYVGLDQKIRDLENGGNHAEAVRFCISMKPGESNWAFSRFDDALGKTLYINQHAFDAAVAQGFATVNGLELMAFGANLLVVVLAVAGVRPRLHEYA